MNSFRLNIKLGHVLYSIVVVLAAVLRLLRLGELPLTNQEAIGALQAAQATSFGSATFSEAYQTIPQPAYEILTRALFQIFGAEDLTARIVPALAGILLVLTPLLARKRIGFGHSLLMGFLLAILPIFVTVSRTASGITLSALGLLTFFMAIIGQGEESGNAPYILAGVGFGLAMTSGPYMLPALLSSGLGLLLWLLIRPKKIESERIQITVDQFRTILIAAGFAVFSFATGIGSSIEGISRFFESISHWIQGWNGGSSFSGPTLLVMLPTYMPVLLVLGLLGAWTSLRERNSYGYAGILIALIGLVLGLFYPSRQPHDLLWVALPLAYLGSKYIVSFIQHVVDQSITPWVIALSLILILLSFMAYLQISSNASQELPIDIFDAWQTPFVFLTLMIVIVSFFGLGWSWISAQQSVQLALLCVTFTLGVSVLWRLNLSSSAHSANELWRNEVPSRGLELLVDTIETTSQSTKGVDEGLKVEIIGDAPPYLIWALREYNPQIRSEAGEFIASPVILAEGKNPELNLHADYIGQTLAIGERWGWKSLLPPDFFNWWVKRAAPTSSEEWLVFIRQDIAFLLDS